MATIPIMAPARGRKSFTCHVWRKERRRSSMSAEQRKRGDSASALAATPAELAGDRSTREASFSRRELLQWSVPVVLAFAAQASQALADTNTHADTPHNDEHFDLDNLHTDHHTDQHSDHNDSYHLDHTDAAN